MIAFVNRDIFTTHNSKFLSVFGTRKPTDVLPQSLHSGSKQSAGRDPRSGMGRNLAPPPPVGVLPGSQTRVQNPPEAGLTETKTSAAARPEPTIPTAPPRRGNARASPAASGPPSLSPGRKRRRTRKLTSGRGCWRGPRRAVPSRPRPQFAQRPRALPPPGWSSSDLEHCCPQKTLSGSRAALLGPPPLVTTARRRARA